MKKSEAMKRLEDYMRNVGYYSGFSGELYIPPRDILNMVEMIGMIAPERKYLEAVKDKGSISYTVERISRTWEPEDV